MSIFKSTLKDYVRNQIGARQELLGSRSTESNPYARPIEVQQYTTAKSPWCKMTSFVDYNDSQELAKGNILMGGSLLPSGSLDYVLRTGIKRTTGAYSVSKQYGIIPMPGINSVTVQSRGAYGSLREATIKFYVWDVDQLEKMKILYMTPGYPILLEWGWSMYLDGKSKKVKKFDIPTIDCFTAGTDLDDIYQAINKNCRASQGNYDGMLGIIKNFEWSLLDSGGFECTTILISVGDVIDSIKVNTVSGDMPSQEDSNDTDKKEYYDEFITILSGLCFYGGSYQYVSGVKSRSTSISGIDSEIYEYTTGVIESPDVKSAPPSGVLKQADPRYFKYIQLAYLIHLLNEKRNLFIGDTASKLLKYEIPLPGNSDNFGNALCVSSYNAMSIDSRVCLIRNSKASLLSEGKGFVPQVSPVKPGPANIPNKQGRDMNEYLYSDTNMGTIGNIYISIGKIIEIYMIESLNNKGKVSLVKFIKAILAELEYSLGSINAFDLYSNDNRLVIIDKHYVEDPNDSQYESKAVINLLGTNTTIREQKTVSKIFQEQSTMIAIAAQDRENIASLQTSTIVAMNKGLTNRLYKNLSDSESGAKIDNIAQQKSIFLNNLRDLIIYVEENILGFQGNSRADVSTIVPTMNNYLNSLITRVERGTDYKGIIPISQEITMDGIGGITIGEIFTLDASVLPKEYKDKSVGYVITEIRQVVNLADWTTTLGTQFCLLNQLEKQLESKESAQKILSEYKRKVISDTSVVRESIIGYNIILAYLHDLYRDMLTIDSNSMGVNREVSKNKDLLSKVYSSYSQAIQSPFPEFKRSSYVGATLNEFDTLYSPIYRVETIPVSRYLNTRIPKEVKKANKNQETFEDNVVRYMRSSIKNSDYYKKLIPEIKEIADDTISKIETKYRSLLGTIASIGTSINLGLAVGVETITGGLISPQSIIERDTESLTESLTFYLLNPDAISTNGTVDRNVLYTTTKVKIEFDDMMKRLP